MKKPKFFLLASEKITRKNNHILTIIILDKDLIKLRLSKRKKVSF